MRRGLMASLAVLLCGGRAGALGPHELLLLVNTNAPDSVAVGEYFARVRGVPAPNVVRLGVPPGAVSAAGGIGRDDFTRWVWEPARAAERERGLADRVLAWVYSAGFPVSVGSQPTLSITGQTFVRNVVPETDLVERGLYASPLFAGPAGPDGLAGCPQTLDVARGSLGAEMPLPSMMLGFTGGRGNSVEEVLRCLDRGAAADGTAPTGIVWFVRSRDVRSRVREWQQGPAAAELAALGVAAREGVLWPVRDDPVLGLMAGAPEVNPVGGRYLPGAMAEHLTSFGAVFDSPSQTKLSAWIRAGATASAGTVTEPYALWTKFPAARFYVHYAWGCTMLESFYLSTRCPLQLLPVGEPLAQPWAPRARLELGGLPDGPVQGRLRITARVVCDPSLAFGDYLFLIDGRAAGCDNPFELDAAGLSEGPHVLRAVACRRGFVRAQVWAEATFAVRHEAAGSVAGEGATAGAPGAGDGP